MSKKDEKIVKKGSCGTEKVTKNLDNVRNSASGFLYLWGKFNMGDS